MQRHLTSVRTVTAKHGYQIKEPATHATQWKESPSFSSCPCNSCTSESTIHIGDNGKTSVRLWGLSPIPVQGSTHI